jgi:hypothetical protein
VAAPDADAGAASAAPVGARVSSPALRSAVDWLARVPGIVWIVLIALVAWLLEPNAYPSYDYAFSMSAAQDILSGRDTGYTVPIYSPVAHPLTILVAIVTYPLGAAQFPVFTAIVLLAFGLLVWSVARLGTTVFNLPTGILAGALVFLSPVIFELGVRTYGDVAFAALAVYAASLEARSPRRGWPVMVILVLAGLIRPEGWVLGGLYWLWLFPSRTWRERAGLAGLVVFAPIAWSVMDWAMTGDPTHSITHTEKYTERVGAGLGIFSTPEHIWTALTALMPTAVVIGIVAGLVFAWRHARPLAWLPFILGITTLALTTAPSIMGDTPVLRRYLIVPAAMIALFCAAAVAGWLRLNRGPERYAWMAIAAVIVVATAFAVPGVIAHWNTDREYQADKVMLLDDAKAFATHSPAERYLRDPRCHPIYTPGYGYRPYLRYWLDVPTRAVAYSFLEVSPPRGSVLLPTSADRYQRAMLAGIGESTTKTVLANEDFRRRYRLVASNDRWQLYGDAACQQVSR